MQNDPKLTVEQYTRASSQALIVIPAGETLAFNAYGKSFYLIEASGPVGITTANVSEKFYKKGQGEDYPDQLRFDRLELRNSGPGEITVFIWAGFGKFVDSRFEVLEAYTDIVGSNVSTTTIPNGDNVNLIGTPTGNQIQRKSVIISNLDANGILVIKDQANAYCCAVFPLTSITFPAAGFVQIVNESGADIACYISEMWYTQRVAS